MEEIWQRIVANLLGRLDGPLNFRFILQPLMAVFFAIIGGIKDARLGKPAYLWAVIAKPGHRQELLKGCWKSVGKIFILAIVLDVFYQLKVHGRIYPGETLVVAFALAIVPYVIVRGPVNRIMRLFMKDKHEADHA